MAYLILSSNFFERDDVKEVEYRWGIKGLGMAVRLLHYLQQCDDGQCDLSRLSSFGRKLGTTTNFLKNFLSECSLFRVDDGVVSAPIVTNKIMQSNRRKGMQCTPEKTPQMSDSQAKSVPYHEHEHEHDYEHEHEHENQERDKDKDYDVVDNAREALIDFGPDADDVDFLKFCIDKIFSQSMWVQSLAAEGRFPIAYELKDGGGVAGGRYAWRDDLTELTKEWFRMRMMALKDFRTKSGDDMKQYFFHLMRPGSRTREEYVEWMKKRMKN